MAPVSLQNYVITVEKAENIKKNNNEKKKIGILPCLLTLRHQDQVNIFFISICFVFIHEYAKAIYICNLFSGQGRETTETINFEPLQRCNTNKMPVIKRTLTAFFFMIEHCTE